jgi:predicted DNA-binding transcriptional regulator AlpA
MRTPSEYITDAQFCILMMISPRTSNQWRRENKAPPYMRVGLRRILYKRTDVEAWIASRTFRHRAAEVTSKKQDA